ncbi:MAG: hypothetical protein ABI345_10895 [Jatrophihabitans sp.]
MNRWAAALAVALVTLLGAGPATAAPGRALFRITDPRITEASGIALGRVSPNVYYVQNDSGDPSRFFALNRRTGTTAAVVEVPGVRNHDWEDLAVAPDRSGRSSVWLADTGDNRAERAEIQVIRVDEPVIDATGNDVRITSSAPDVWHLRYPTGPTDAESLAVGPDGTPYLITKSVLGTSTVYRVPGEAGATVRTLQRVATVTFAPTGTSGGPAGLIGQVTATGASLSSDGAVLAIRTYTDAYVWRVENADIAAALRARPLRIPLPQQPQGEGVAVAPGELVVDSEGVDEAVYAVPLPDLAASAPSAHASPATTAIGVGEPERGRQAGPGRATVLVGIGVAAAALIVVLGLLASTRRRHRAGDRATAP